MPERVCPRLIEVALPIREISAESVRDKSLRHGHISTLHLWWARRPLPASRAVVFASLVPDPDHPDCPAEFRQAVLKHLRDDVPAVLKGYRRGRDLKRDPDPYRPYADIPDTARNRLLTFIAKWSPEWQAFEKGQVKKQPPPAEMLDDRSLVKWDTSDPQNEQGRAVLAIARALVLVANGGQSPTLLDPFAGGGAIPLEAARLGCQAIANDYNPVAYLILRATCEFPQKCGKPGKRMVERDEYGEVKHEGIDVENVLAYDVDYWAKWILERAHQRIGRLYPSGKDGLPVIGYLWTRTVPCSNCRASIPLLQSSLICKKPNKQVALTISVNGKETIFGIARNNAITRTEGTMLKGGDCRCPVCDQLTPVEDIRRAGLDGKIGERMAAVIVEGSHGKEYRLVESVDLNAFEDAQKSAETVERPSEFIVPEINAPNAPKDAGAHRSISVDIYGYKTFGSLFNSRQLVSMQTFVTLLKDAILEMRYPDEYKKAIAIYLGLWVSRMAPRMSTICTWWNGDESFHHPFTGQRLPMVWDFGEPNLLNDASGGALSQLDWILRVIKHESTIYEVISANIIRGDGSSLRIDSDSIDIVTTDPPYFDSIAYADLSDFFYVWLKRGLAEEIPEAFATPQTPTDTCIIT